MRWRRVYCGLGHGREPIAPAKDYLIESKNPKIREWMEPRFRCGVLDELRRVGVGPLKEALNYKRQTSSRSAQRGASNYQDFCLRSSRCALCASAGPCQA